MAAYLAFRMTLLAPFCSAELRCVIVARLCRLTRRFVYTTSFGNQLEERLEPIEANQPLTFSLNVRRHGITQLALLDSDSIHVTLDPSVEADADVSGDRRFVTVVPKATFGDAGGSTLAVRLEGRYFTGFERDGGRFVGGTPAGRLDQTFQFQLRPHPASGIRLTVPKYAGDPAGGWDLYRLAAPLPTILPSYNQIGFDSIHCLIGLVEGGDRRAVGWVVGGRVADAGESRHGRSGFARSLSGRS